MGIQEQVLFELGRRRTDLVVTIERSMAEGDRHGFVAGWLAEVTRFEKRITDLGGTFESWEFPRPPTSAIAIAVDEPDAMDQERLDKEPAEAEPATEPEQPADSAPSPTSTAGRE